MLWSGQVAGIATGMGKRPEVGLVTHRCGRQQAERGEGTSLNTWSLMSLTAPFQCLTNTTARYCPGADYRKTADTFLAALGS